MSASRNSALRPSVIDRLLRPLHRWIWADPHRRARKLLRFADTEERGGRDLCRAAELSRDVELRRLLLRHASDEQRHANLFRTRGRRIVAEIGCSPRRALEANWLSPGERGLDALDVDGMTADELLAFLHLSEKAAARRFVLYEQVLDTDPLTQAVFRDVLRDEVFHMRYTRTQLARIWPRQHGLKLWQGRARRVWKAYLRIAVAVASLLGSLFLYLQYFVVLPVFALVARRSARREIPGWKNVRAAVPLERQT